MAVDPINVHAWADGHDWRVACLAHWGMPKTVDLRRFARESQHVEGAFAIRRLVRLLEGLPEQPLVKKSMKLLSKGRVLFGFH